MSRRIWVAGHRGMVGSAIVRQLQGTPDVEILTVSRSLVDLRDQKAVERWLKANRPDIIVIAAAKVGGILANDSYPAEFLFENLAIEINIIHGAHLADVNRLVFLGSSCIYPRMAPQPIRENALLTGPLELTNEWYAIAKIAGIKMCQAYRKQYGRNYISVMPCNLYGINDNFAPKTSHVLPALIRKVHEAKTGGAREIVVWGTGTPLREFLYVDDLARGVVFCMDHFNGCEHINCGAGQEISIQDLAETVKRVVGFDGPIVFDTSKPDGTPRKLMDSSRLHAMGWRPQVALQDGIRRSYEWFLANKTETERGRPIGGPAPRVSE